MKAFLFFLFIISTAACTKRVSYTPVDGTLKKHFDYNLGSYWIMRDSISGRVDSFVVTANNFYQFTNINRYANAIGISIEEYTNGQLNIDGLGWGVSLVGTSFYLNVASTAYPAFYVTNGRNLFNFPFKENTNLSVLPSYSLNGNAYSNVAEIDFNAGDIAWYYINSDVGFIKIRINSSLYNFRYVWELQRYNIVY